MTITYGIKRALEIYEEAISKNLVINKDLDIVYKAMRKDENGNLVPLNPGENMKAEPWTTFHEQLVPEYGKKGYHCSTRIEDLFDCYEFSEKTLVYMCEIPEGAILSLNDSDCQFEDYGKLATDTIRIIYEMTPREIVEEMKPKRRLVSKFSSLPEANYAWTSVRQLVFDDSPIETLPNGLKFAVHLNELCLRYTNVRTIPDIFEHMDDLMEIHCEGSPICVSESWPAIERLLSKDSFFAITGIPLWECPAAKRAGFKSKDLADGMMCDIVYSDDLGLWVWSMPGVDPVWHPEGMLGIVGEGLD